MISADWSSAGALLRCPLCAGGLVATDGALRCERGHAFDIARECYVNLLAPGRSAPKLAGDSQSMLRARRAFLDHGHYQPLSDAINTAVARRLAQIPLAQAPHAALDAGCGEGYYLGRLGAHVREQGGMATTLFGLDVARAAVRMAAGRYSESRFVVADVNAPLPFADAGLAAVLDVFAPRNPPEFARVLAPGGLLLVALPTPAHLAELRALVPLLRIEPEKAERAIARLSAAFTLASALTLEYPLALSGADAALLVRMSPSARHVAPDALAALAMRERAPVTASFNLLGFTKRN